MSIINFVKAMLPRVQKSSIEEDIRTTIKELENITIPRYKATGEHLRVAPLKDGGILSMQKQFYSDMAIKYQGSNMIQDIGSAMDRILINLGQVDKIVDQVLDGDVLNEGLSVKKAHVVRAVGCMSFISTFGLEFLEYVLMCEQVANGADEPVDEYKTKYILGRYRSFFQKLSDYSMDPEKFKKAFLELPEAIITSKNADSLSSMFNPSKLDPFPSMGVTGFTGNPIYHVRLLVATWQGARVNVNKDRKRLLELRLLHLQELEQDSHNPKLEQEIDYLQKRVDKLDKSIREAEEDVGL